MPFKYYKIIPRRQLFIWQNIWETIWKVYRNSNPKRVWFYYILQLRTIASSIRYQLISLDSKILKKQDWHELTCIF